MLESLFKKVAGLPATLLKKDSNTGAFLWILRNFYEKLYLWNTSWWLLQVLEYREGILTWNGLNNNIFLLCTCIGHCTKLIHNYWRNPQWKSFIFCAETLIKYLLQAPIMLTVEKYAYGGCCNFPVVPPFHKIYPILSLKVRKTSSKGMVSKFWYLYAFSCQIPGYEVTGIL